MGGLEKLVDFLLSWIRVLRFWIIVNENEHGIVLRFGRWHRVDPDKFWPFGPKRWPRLCKFTRLANFATYTNGYAIGPGLHLKFFSWDHEFTCSTSTETRNLRVQSLSCLDGTRLQVSGVFKYEIADAYKYWMEIGDEENFIDDLFYGAIADEIVQAAEWPFNVGEMKKRIKTLTSREAREFGFRIRSFKFQNLTPANTLRLFNE